MYNRDQKRRREGKAGGGFLVLHGYLEHPGLLEAPERERLRQRGIARLERRLARHLHLSCEELVREEVQGAGENDTGIVSRLRIKDDFFY